MPKLTQSSPKYRLHKATGQAVVTLNGKDHYLGPHGTKASRLEYDRLTAIWLAGGRGLAHRGESVTVVEVLAAYWRFAKGYYVKGGQQTNEVDALKLVIADTKRLFGSEPAKDFGPLKLKAVRQVWIGKGQSRPTVNKNQRRLTRIFRWAVSEELVPGSVIHALASVPGLKLGRCDSPEPPPVLPVAIDVVERTLDHVTPILCDMVHFQLATGCRPGEVCSMTPGDIDRNGDVWEYRVEGHKTQHHGKTRIVFIGPQAQAILAPYLLRPADAVCFSMSEHVEQRRSAKHERRVTPESCGNRRGWRSNADQTIPAKRRKRQEQFTSNSYRKAIHSACDVAFNAPQPIGRSEGESNQARINRLTESQRKELESWQIENRWSPNQLRHTKATQIRKMFGIEGSQVVLGHSDASVTEIYAERDFEKAREIARQVG